MLAPHRIQSLRVFAPAKINWSLVIERRRADGYHDIVTIFQTLAWGDELLCRPLRERTCRIHCDDPAVPLDERNLIWRAWNQIATAFPERVRGLDVRLIKRIPAGGGLGGGSSDAAATLLALRRLYELPLRARQLEAEAAKLGSDCAFFIRGGTALGRGRGEELSAVRCCLPAMTLVLVWPGFPSSTAAAYGGIKPRHWESGQMVEQVTRALGRGDVKALIKRKRNVFEQVVIPGDARYAELIRRMRAAGLDSPTLSGSGSTMFGFASDGNQAAVAVRELAQHYPLAQAVRLRASGVRIMNATAATK